MACREIGEVRGWSIVVWGEYGLGFDSLFISKVDPDKIAERCEAATVGGAVAAALSYVESQTGVTCKALSVLVVREGE